MDVDVLDAVRALLLADVELVKLVGDRVATKHQFGGDWETPGSAVVFRYSGGPSDVDLAWQTPRLEIRCYGESARAAGRVYNAVSDVARGTKRQVVAVEDASALVYYFILTSGPSLLYDPDVGLDMVLVFAAAAVAEAAVS
jgi:hypothetical protein